MMYDTVYVSMVMLSDVIMIVRHKIENSNDHP
jgi:hypothetical protein